MNDPSEYRQLLKTARELSRLPIDPAAGRGAVDAVRRRLTQAGRSQRRRRLLIISGSIAAAVGIFALIAVNLILPKKVDAAAELQDAAQATHAYKGWVHITLANQSIFDLMKSVTLVGLHINTADGTTAVVARFFWTYIVEMSVPSTHQSLTYIGVSHELSIVPLGEKSAAESMKRNAALPLNLPDFLAQMKAWGLHDPDVVESMDGSLKRFDLTPRDDPRKVPDEYREMVSYKIVIWVDPQTKLIRRMQELAGGRLQVMEYTYGAPKIRDIYDLGVPRSATVMHDNVDASHSLAVFKVPPTTQLVKDDSLDVKSLQDRLQKRNATGFGDYVMVEFEERPDYYRQGGKLTLQARQGDKAMNSVYEFGMARAFLGFGRGSYPAGWPEFKLADVLSQLRWAYPDRGEIFDGTSAWSVGMPAATVIVDASGKAEVISATQSATHIMLSLYTALNLETRFWPREGMFWSVSMPSVPAAGKKPAGFPQTKPVIHETQPILDGTTKSEILHDPARPKMIVLHVEQTMPFKLSNAKSNYKTDALYWLDPARDDLPTETVIRNNSWGGDDKLDNATHYVYLDFKRTTDGRWYPSHWQYRMFIPLTTQPVQDDGYTESWRQILQDQKLPPDWFGDPYVRLNRTPSTMQLH